MWAERPAPGWWNLEDITSQKKAKFRLRVKLNFKHYSEGFWKKKWIGKILKHSQTFQVKEGHREKRDNDNSRCFSLFASLAEESNLHSDWLACFSPSPWGREEGMDKRKAKSHETILSIIPRQFW